MDSSINVYYIFLIFIVIIKILYIFFLLLVLYIQYVHPEETKLLEDMKYWRNRLEFIFIANMSILLTYLFYPRETPLSLDTETRFLLYIYGIFVLLTPNWFTFFQDSKWLQIIKKYNISLCNH
jgi:hypothetical protein